MIPPFVNPVAFWAATLASSPTGNDDNADADADTEETTDGQVDADPDEVREAVGLAADRAEDIHAKADANRLDDIVTRQQYGCLTVRSENNDEAYVAADQPVDLEGWR